MTAYIKHNIIAMGYPADRMESVYRNNREEVIKFLNEKHPENYKVYNLCKEKTYDATPFPVSFESFKHFSRLPFIKSKPTIENNLMTHYNEYPFEDHNPPDIELINKFCEDVHRFLCEDPKHVVAIHCKAGKGRTGTMICCYLLYSKACQTADQALKFYAEKRTWDHKGVTIPSQRRYVQYYEQLLRKQLTYENVTLYICELRIIPADVPLKFGTIKVKGSKESPPLTDFQRSDECVTVVLDACMPLTGDVKVEFARVRNLKEKRWHFWINTFFVKQTGNYDSQGRLVLTLDRMEIDDAHKGNTKKCPEQVCRFFKLFPTTTRLGLCWFPGVFVLIISLFISRCKCFSNRYLPAPFDVASSASNSPSSKVNYKKQQPKPPPTQLQSTATTVATAHQQLNHSGGSSEEISGTDSVEEDDYEEADEKEEDDEEEEEEEEEGWESGECQTVVSQTMCKSRTTTTTTTTTTTVNSSTTTTTTATTTTSSRTPEAAITAAAVSSTTATTTMSPTTTTTKQSSILPFSSPRRCLVSDENYLLTRSSSYLISNSNSSKSSSDHQHPVAGRDNSTPNHHHHQHHKPASSELVPVEYCTVSSSSSPAYILAGAGELPARAPGATKAGDSSLALMVYEPRGLVPVVPEQRVPPTSPSPSKGGSGGFPFPLVRRSPKGSGVAPIGTAVGSSSSSGGGIIEDRAPNSSVVPRGDDAGGKSKFISSSPFRRFGMAMQRKKKRSLKLKHSVTTGNASTTAVSGAAALYGSCASNLSGVSVGSGSKASGGSIISSGKSKMKFRWLRNMRSDPNLKETLAKSVQLRSVTATGGFASAFDQTGGPGKASGGGGVMIPKSPTVDKTCFVGIFEDEGRAERTAAAEGKVGTTRDNDYYSFLCDNQLSYESPSKSPGHLMRLELPRATRRPSTIEEVLLQQPLTTATTTVVSGGCETEGGCSVVKPRASNVRIGFDVSPVPQSPVAEKVSHQVGSDDADNLTSIESSFEIIDKCDAMTVSTAIKENPSAVGGGGNRFCNKLLHHIVSSVGSGGRKGELVAAPGNELGTSILEHRQHNSKADVDEAASTKIILDRRPSSSAATSTSLPGTPTKPPAPATDPRSCSPILARSNRCAPFSFRELSQELRAAMKIPKRAPFSQTASSATTTPGPSSSSSSSSFSNVGGGGDCTIAGRSIERTLSAPVAVQSLDTTTTTRPNTSATTTATTTTATTTDHNTRTIHQPFHRTLNRSQSDRQLLGEDRSKRSK
ncbi:AGAP009628-PA-like protein [Anopheles sinensis]|uniref:AGAP009628-PA-like protein n=1 Tax=Anopheles sinensis TaxID=74873 RepID=A0A084VNH6_ANOSI|nr:AGAP009628-PA-like protein [Anopheles sinensis]